MEGADHSVTKYEAVGDIVERILALMAELCQSGFDTVHDSTLQEMGKAAKTAEQYGMRHLSGLLKKLTDDISAGRHQMTKQTAQMAELYTEINEYLYLCRQKIAYDQGMDQYK